MQCSAVSYPPMAQVTMECIRLAFLDWHILSFPFVRGLLVLHIRLHPERLLLSQAAPILLHAMRLGGRGHFLRMPWLYSMDCVDADRPSWQLGDKTVLSGEAPVACIPKAAEGWRSAEALSCLHLRKELSIRHSSHGGDAAEYRFQNKRVFDVTYQLIPRFIKT